MLVGCADDYEEELETIEDAFEQNKTLENGTFETNVTIQNESETIEQKIEGSFIQKEDSTYDWYTLSYPNADMEDNYSEQVRVDGILYEKITVPEQEDLPWEEISEDAPHLPDQVERLFDLQDLEEVESVTTEEREGNTIYKVTLEDSFSEHIIEENVEELEETIESLEESNVPEERIQASRNRLDQIRETTYSDFVYTYVVDNQGHGIVVENESVVTEPEGNSYTIASSYELTEYNVEDTENLIPTVQE